MNGKLRGEKRHEKIGNVRHGGGNILCLLQAQSKILFLIKQEGELLQGVSFLSFSIKISIKVKEHFIPKITDAV